MVTARTTPVDAAPLGIAARTVIVTGKGGVGKSTVAAALAIAWRDAGARTILVELAGHASAAALLSTRPVTYEPTPLGERLFALRISLDNALKEYARMRLKVRLVADTLVGNPVIHQFSEAAPGFRELLVLGKLWSLARAVDKRGRRLWDAIVVDAPATGHGVGLLGMAGVVARAFPVGPIATEARSVDAFVRDPAETGVVLVSLPEELPVSETIELRSRLGDQGVPIAATILNGLVVDRFTADEADTAARLARDGSTPETLRATLGTAAWEHARCAEQARERARLEQSVPDPALLPFMYVPELELAHITGLAHWMGDHGQSVLRAQLAGAPDGPAAAASVHADSSSGVAE